MKSRQKLLLAATTVLALNLLCAGTVMGQELQSTEDVNNNGSLSFYAIPTSFDFGTTGIPATRQTVFSNPSVTTGALPTSKRLTVEDTRNSGGFTVSLGANANFSDGHGDSIPVGNISPNDNLRIVTSTLIDPTDITGTTGDCPSTTIPCVIYESGYDGTPDAATTENINAPVNTTGTNFDAAGTFTALSGNILDTSQPVEVLNGSLSADQGRVGHITVGISSMLYIPAFQASGQYTTTLTWTLTDSES
jgi:hypothetical protein